MSDRGDTLPEPVTAQDVVSAFKEAGGRRCIPDDSAVMPLVEFIDDNAWSDVAIMRTERRFRGKSPLMDPFWKALKAIDTSGNEVLESLRYRHEQHLAFIARNNLPPFSGYNDQASKLDELLRLAEELRSSLFPPWYGKRHERWHDLAPDIARLVAEAYRVVGHNTTDFRTSSSPGVAMVIWVLGKFGHHVEAEAVAQFFKRSGTRTTRRP